MLSQNHWIAMAVEEWSSSQKEASDASMLFLEAIYSLKHILFWLPTATWKSLGTITHRVWHKLSISQMQPSLLFILQVRPLLCSGKVCFGRLVRSWNSGSQNNASCTRVHWSIRCQEVKLTIIYHICCSTQRTKIIKDLTCRNIAVNEEMHRKSKILVIHFTTPFCGNYNLAFFILQHFHQRLDWMAISWFDPFEFANIYISAVSWPSVSLSPISISKIRSFAKYSLSIKRRSFGPRGVFWNRYLKRCYIYTYIYIYTIFLHIDIF